MKPTISTQDLSIKFPIYDIRKKSLKISLLDSFVGGEISMNSSKIVSVDALKNITIDLYAGDRVALIGNNGSGKSTLLKTLAGIYSPSDGSIITVGSIATLLDITLGLNHDATGLENIMLRGLLLGASKKRILSITDDIIEFSGLKSFIHLPLRTYSTGMAMRLAFSVSTFFDADILLMDEWLSVGDAEFSIKAREKLLQMISKSKVLVLASHDYELCKQICNKFIHLDHGKITRVTSTLS